MVGKAFLPVFPAVNVLPSKNGCIGNAFSNRVIARSAERSEARSADYSVQTGRQWDPVRLCVVCVCVVCRHFWDLIHLWGFSNYRRCADGDKWRQKRPSYTYGDFQTTGAVQGAVFCPHTPMEIFKLPLLCRWRQMATNGDKQAVWDTFGGQIAAGSGLYGIKK